MNGQNAVIGKLQTYAQRVREHMPDDGARSRSERVRIAAPAFGLLAMLDVNDWLIERFASDLPRRWDPTTYTWAADVEAAWPLMQAEVLDYMAQHRIPETSEINGLDPDSDEAKRSVPADVGAWRSLVLQWFGKDIEANARHFPETMRAVGSLSGITSFGFTALDRRAHIAEHRGPNRGAVRYQLPIIVPGPPGACRIRVGEEMICWNEGECVVFDLSEYHEVWNDTDEVRVLLMIEVPMPLPFPLSIVNRWTQSLYRYFPTFRGLPDRVGQLADQPPDSNSAAIRATLANR